MHIREYEMITVECLSKVTGSDGFSMRNASRQGDSDLITRQFRVEDSRVRIYMISFIYHLSQEREIYRTSCLLLPFPDPTNFLHSNIRLIDYISPNPLSLFFSSIVGLCIGRHGLSPT